MAAFLDICRFNPTLGGTTDWTYSNAVAGCNSPALAGIVNGTLYKYRAESADLSQWEMGEGAYNTTTGVLARTTVLYNSSGTGTAAGQTGAGTKINFSTVPQVAIVALKEDLISVQEANSFTTNQKMQAQANILVPRTSQKFLSGSGTYTTPAGCTMIRIRMVGGGGGGAGSGTSSGAGGAGGNTTFGTALLTANGGAGGTNGLTTAAGGTASGGNIANIAGGNGPFSAASAQSGNHGASSVFGGAGSSLYQAAGVAAQTNSGSGGGSGWYMTTGNSAMGGAAGGYVEHAINNPAATYSYAVGAGGTAGVTGTSGFAGAAGAAGIIIVEEFYGS